MEEMRRPRGVLKRVPQDRRKRGRPRKGWPGHIKEAMEARDLAEEDCCRREKWRVGTEKLRPL
jgi:hypothetical protein